MHQKTTEKWFSGWFPFYSQPTRGGTRKKKTRPRTSPMFSPESEAGGPSPASRRCGPALRSRRLALPRRACGRSPPLPPIWGTRVLVGVKRPTWVCRFFGIGVKWKPGGTPEHLPPKTHSSWVADTFGFRGDFAGELDLRLVKPFRFCVNFNLKGYPHSSLVALQKNPTLCLGSFLILVYMWRFT